MDGLHLVEENILTRAYIILVFRHLHSLHFRILKPLKECTLTHLGYVVVRSHPGNLVYGRRLLGKLRTSFLQAVNSILVAMEQGSSLPEL